jgi:hypothetical protein
MFDKLRCYTEFARVRRLAIIFTPTGLQFWGAGGFFVAQK